MQFFGCTHYPLIEQEIAETLGGNIKFFNGAPRLAKHLYEILQENDLIDENEGKIEFYDSNHSEKKKERFFNNVLS